MSSKTRIIMALWLWMLVNYLDRVAMSFAGPSIMKSLSMSPDSFGIILSSFGLGYLLAQIPGGLIADRWGAKAMLVAGPICWAGFTGLTGLVTTLAGFVAVRICLGISEGLSVMSIHRVVGDHFDAKSRARALGICFTALAVAPAIAGFFVPKLITAWGWQAMFVLMMVPTLLAALSSQLLIPSSPPVIEHPEETGSFAHVLRQPSFWVLSIAYLGYNIAFWGYLGWMPSYLSMAHGIDLKTLGALGGIPYVFAFFGLLIGGWLGTGLLHRHRPQLMAGMLAFAGASLFVAYQADGIAQSLAGLSSAAFFLYGCQGSQGAIILDLAPERFRGTYSGCVSTVGQIGGLIAPATVGFLVGVTGTFGSGFGFMVVALCVAALAYLALVPMTYAKASPALAGGNG